MCKVTLFDNFRQNVMAIGNFLLNVLKGLGKGLLSGLGINIGSNGSDFSGFGQNVAGTASNIASMEYAAGIRARENEHLTGKEQEQNMFNSKEAALQRDFAHEERIQSQDFNAAQAQNQMDFQERMASTQYQRSVADMQAAGVNPALAMGGIQGASASGAMASSSPASGAAASGSSQLQGLSDLLEFASLKASIDKIKAETKKTEADAEKTEAETKGQTLQNLLTETYGAQRADAELRSIEQSISESLARTGEAATRSALNSAMAELTKVQTDTEEFKQAEAKWRKEFIDQWNMPPELAGDLVKAAATLVGAGLMSVSSILKFFKSADKGSITRKIKVPAGEVVVTKPIK